MIIVVILIIAAIAIVAAEPGIAAWLARGQPDYDAEKFNCSRCGVPFYGWASFDAHWQAEHSDFFVVSAKSDRRDIGAGFTDDDLG